MPEKLVWDQTGERFYETGCRNVVHYPQAANGTYPKGYAWNGFTKLTESPDGADPKDFFAGDRKYLSVRSKENFKGSMEAYTYPDSFAECNGTASPVKGMYVGQQTRKPFGLTYRTSVGNDTEFSDHAYKLHFIWNATVSPSSTDYNTENDDVEINPFSWEFATVPVDTNIEGCKPSSYVVLDSREVSAAKMKQIEDIIYGSSTAEARLPLPDELYTILKATEQEPNG